MPRDLLREPGNSIEWKNTPGQDALLHESRVDPQRLTVQKAVEFGDVETHVFLLVGFLGCKV